MEKGTGNYLNECLAVLHDIDEARFIGDLISQKAGTSPDLYADIVGAVVDKYARYIYTIACSFFNDDDAKEIIQEVSLKIFLNLKGFTGKNGSRLKSWIYRIILNACRDYYRRKNRHPIDQLDWLPLKSLEDNTCSWIDHEQIFQSIYTDEIVAQLGKNLSPLLRQYIFEDRSYRELCTEYQLPLGAVKNRLFRAKGQIKEKTAKLLCK